MKGAPWLRSALLAGPTLVSIFATSRALGQSPSAADILAQSRKAYGAMRSYSSVGGVRSTFGDRAPQEHATTTFTLRLARPDLYRIEWHQGLTKLPFDGAAWSAGDGYFLLTPGQTKPGPAKDLDTALAMATGVSAGVANWVPGVFFDRPQNMFTLLRDVTLGPDETVEGEPCYVLRARLNENATTLWISKRSQLLRQIRSDAAKGPMEMPEPTDDLIRESLRAMNREPTDAAIAEMREMFAHTKKMMAESPSSFSIETQRRIKVDLPLTPADFAPPVGGDGT